ncbi:myeloid-derived growth factor isoform X1 [Hyla sarda]|uniref:myeloid-derived growth factor isoform X1 n=1 Tax=Hyla sarda TaxID=327740 RepID=UPI0024C391B0|nr:myeloid-derived growth factor isoform X1 [Hyla sarda]
MAAAVLLSVALLLCLSSHTKAEPTGNTEEFDVKPGGLDYTYTRKLGGFSCSFSYAAQGGTNEKWLMSIGVDEESRYFSCSIWRPLGTSYLFFTKFKAEVSGGKIEFCEAYNKTCSAYPSLALKIQLLGGPEPGMEGAVNRQRCYIVMGQVQNGHQSGTQQSSCVLRTTGLPI